MATIGEMIVKLIADTGNFNTDMAEAATTVKTSQDAMASSMASSMAAFRDFDNISKESVKTTEGLTTAQAALNAARESGAFTTDELAAKEALVASAMQKVGTETEAASGVVGMFTRNSRTMYSTSALITDAMTGQFSRMRREVAALGNETGLMASAFRVMFGPIGLAVAAVGGFAFAAAEGAENANKLTDALAATGGALGVTDSQITAMRDGLVDADTTVGEATDLVSKLALSGRFLGSELGDAAQAAQEMAQLTGESMNQAATAVESLAKGPVKAIQTLNDQLHFLSVPEAQQIANLLKVGDAAGAAAAAIRDLANAEGENAQKAQQAQGWIGSYIDSFKSGLHSMEAAAESWGAPETLQQKLGDTQEEIEKIANTFHATLDFKGGEHIGNAGLMDRDAQDQINALLTQRTTLMSQISTENEKAAQEARQTADTTKETSDLIAQAGKGTKGGGSMSSLEQEFQEQEAKAHASYQQMQQDAADFWNEQATNANNSTALQAAAWQRYSQIRHQLDEQTLSSSERAERQATEASREAEQARGRLVRQTTSEIKQEMQKQAEAVAAAEAQQIQEAQQAARSSVQAATQNYQKIADALHSQYELHQITADQEVTLEQAAAQREYEADLAAYQKELALMQGKPKEVAKVNAQIESLNRQHDAQMQKLDEQAALTYQRTWETRLRPVSNAFDQMINGMIQGTQTLRQTMTRMLSDIAASFIKTSIDNTVRWVADEIAQTRATQAEATQRVMITQSAAQQTEAAEAATGQKQIMSAAATAAAKAYQAVVGIPYVGPVLAPVAAGVAFAAVEGFTSDLASAAGGWERVPADGMRTELHRDEMVLPKSVADPVRNMARNGGGGSGTTNVHIHSMDSRSFRDFLSRNPAAIQSALRRSGRNGWRA